MSRVIEALMPEAHCVPAEGIRAEGPRDPRGVALGEGSSDIVTSATGATFWCWTKMER